MTIAERNNKLKHYITCLKCGVSGKECDDNCATQYEAGNMGEIIENLEAISKALEQEPILDKIRAEIEKETDRDNHADDYCDGYYDGMRNALAIIDKYKAELNPQESEDDK